MNGGEPFLTQTHLRLVVSSTGVLLSTGSLECDINGAGLQFIVILSQVI